MSFAANMYLYLVEGVVICVTNITLLWCILSDHRNRRRREFILVAAQSITDIFYGVAFMLIAHLRLGLFYENKLSTLVPTSSCAYIPALWLHNIATPLLGLLPITTSVNFLVCSVAPLWYMRASHMYTLGLMSPAISLAIILLSSNAFLLIGVETPIASLCIAANGAAHPVVYHIMLFCRIAANLGSAIIYGVILIYLQKNHGGSLKELSPQQLKMHRNAKITLGLVTTNSMILLFCPDVLLFFNPWNITKTYSTPLYSMTLSKTMINFGIYMARYRELRNIILTKLIACLPQKWSIPLSAYLRSANEASTVPRGTSFVTRSSIQVEKFTPNRRKSSVIPRPKVSPISTINNNNNAFQRKLSPPIDPIIEEPAAVIVSPPVISAEEEQVIRPDRLPPINIRRHRLEDLSEMIQPLPLPQSIIGPNL